MTFALEYEDEIENAPLLCAQSGNCHCRSCRSHESAAEAWGEDSVSQWTGSSEQVAFRERVLQTHIARSGRKSQPKPDLTRDRLGPVDGTKTGPNGTILMRKDAAESAGRLLTAANAALAKAKLDGEADALRTIRITANSGNRSRAEQAALWRRYFSRAKTGYYDLTSSARQSLAGGPHSPAAVAYMLDNFRVGNRIAAPGYSNHNGGIAIDFWQVRTKGWEIPNQTDRGFPSGGGPSWKKWRATWFFNWLTANAASFHFYPYSVEPWHWEYGATGPSREGETSSARTRARRSAPAPLKAPLGSVGTFTSSALPLRVAVYCPKEAIAQPSVDVILYAHGLNGGQCGTPARAPEEFIMKPPFNFGTIVDDSHSGAILVTPFMDWERLSKNGLGFGARSRWHKLAIPTNLNQVVAEAMNQVGQLLGAAAPTLRRLIVAGHSRAYDFLDPLAKAFADPGMSLGALAKLAEVWALDTSYPYDSCPVGDWQKWLLSKPGVKMKMFYRPSSDTADCAGTFAAAARKSGSLITKPVPVPELHCQVPVRRLPALLAALGPVAVPTREIVTDFEG